MDGVREFVKEKMGVKYITNVGFDLREIFDESTAKTPLIFLLSPGRSALPPVTLYWKTMSPFNTAFS